MSHTLNRRFDMVRSSTITLSNKFYENAIKFYTSQPDRDIYSSIIWKNIQGQQQSLHEALVQGNVAAVKYQLENLCDGGALWGFDVCRATPWAFSLDVHESIIVRDFIHALTYLGIVPLLNPEQDNSTVIDTASALERLEDKLGFKLSYDIGGKMDCAQLDGRIIPWRVLHSVYECMLIKQLSNWPASSVLEIGGGTCALHWLLRNSIGDALIYHQIDLPVVSVIQAYLAANVCGEERVQFSGCETVPDPGFVVHGLRYPELVDWQLDLVFNKDSMPEIPAGIATNYLNYAFTRLHKGGFFLSINHESDKGGQTPVSTTVAKFDCMKLERRELCWNRYGYATEIWKKQ